METLKKKLDSLRDTTLPMARILINRGEWGRFKDKDLAKLLSHLKDTTHDAEDLLRELGDQELRQQIENSGQSRACQLLSFSPTLAKRVKEIQDKLDNSMKKVEGKLIFMGLNVESAEQHMPETSSVIADEVFGQDSELEGLMKQLGVPLTRSAKYNGKRAKAAADSRGASTSRPAKRPKGQSRDGAGLDVTSSSQPIQLGGLPHDIFWELFSKCAFGNREPESYPELQVIGKSISSRLCGSPLGAITLGRLLSMQLDVEHWRTVQNSELWQLQHGDNEILPALRLSYLYLPPEHKRCFAFCSMFPKGYSFQRQELVDIWVAEGFVVPKGTERLEDVGMGYLDDLRSRFLFQTDPKFPNKNRYVMNDLIHDMAQSVSVDECFLMQDSSHLVPQTVRHMSVEVDNKSFSRMREIKHPNKLHSLRFRPRLNVEITYFNQLTNILFLSLKGCKLEKLHESICELNSLRYLDISHSKVQKLPEKFWRLYSLQVLDATRSSLQTVHRDITKLINLRQLAITSKAYKALERVSGIGNLSSLRNLKQFKVRKENGWRIGELKGMNQLSGTLTICGLPNVQSKEEASEARLADKQYINVLDLRWGRHTHNANDVMEGLRPHPRIEHLKVRDFSGDRCPSWLNPQDLPNLKSLELRVCRELKTSADGTIARQNHASGSISCSSFSHLTDLRLLRCTELTDLGQFLSPENLPSLRSMKLEDCYRLVSIAAYNFVGFAFLQDLRIGDCHKLVCPRPREMVLPPSLRRLSIQRCGELDRSFPACLKNLTSLTGLGFELLSQRHVHPIEFDRQYKDAQIPESLHVQGVVIH